MIDPFRIEGPAVISFSGGRTSGYMLWRILQAHGGTLPEDVKVIFANTGKEMPETLDFVQECSVRWNVPIIWVEYRGKTKEGKLQETVSWETASRNGEPYALLISERKFLPNPLFRFCTSELKVRPMHRVMRSFGFDEWTSYIGLRADEQRRVAKLSAPSEGKHEERVAPLARARIVVQDIMTFWEQHPFDLALQANSKGNSFKSNCDLCFLKKADHVLSLIREKPERATWWIQQEALVSKIGAANPSTGALFNNGRPSYQQMYDMALSQGEMFKFDDEALQDCMCTD